MEEKKNDSVCPEIYTPIDRMSTFIDSIILFRTYSSIRLNWPASYFLIGTKIKMAND